MRQVVNRVYRFPAKADDLHFATMMDWALVDAGRWEASELVEIISSTIASNCRRGDEGD